MFENICINEKGLNVGVDAMNENETSGLPVQGMIKIMAIPYKKDKALCSPTSALEKKRMNAERGAEESFLTDSDKFIVETYWGHIDESIII